MRPYNQQSGFTLVEMIVSLALFAGVITIAIGALLVLVDANDRLQNEQSIMTNLSFALDSMMREIRTGSDYYCESRTNYSAGGPANVFSDSQNMEVYLTGLDSDDQTVDCEGIANINWQLHGIAFKEGGDSITASNEYILYFHDRTTGTLFRRVADEAAVPIVSSDIFVHDFQVFVSGSDPVSEGGGTYAEQPSVTIFLEASEDETTAVEDRYRVQATVAQRTLDL